MLFPCRDAPGVICRQRYTRCYLQAGMHQVLSEGRWAPGVISRQGCTRCYIQTGMYQVLSPGRNAPGVISRQVCAVKAHLKNRERETEMESTPTLQKNLQLVKVACVLFQTDQP